MERGSGVRSDMGKECLLCEDTLALFCVCLK